MQADKLPFFQKMCPKNHPHLPNVQNRPWLQFLAKSYGIVILISVSSKIKNKLFKLSLLSPFEVKVRTKFRHNLIFF